MTSSSVSRVARVAHELRTPLHGILGAAELLRAAGRGLDDDQRAYVATIEEAARALLRVADDAIAAAAVGVRVDVGDAVDSAAPRPVGGLGVVVAPCDPRAVVDGVRRLLASAAAARGLVLRADVAADVPACVATDAGRVRQVLVNLVGNAVRCTPAGEVVIALRHVDAPGRDAAIALEVRDTGPGLPDSARARLGASEVRPAAPGVRAGEGAGLGLSIVGELVAALGGAVEVESGAAGTTIRVVLPVAAVAAHDAGSGGVADVAGGAGPDDWPEVAAGGAFAGGDATRGAGPDGARMAAAVDDAARLGGVVSGTRVLVVDDDPVGRRVTAGLLGALGCAVDAVGDAAGARACVARGAYDLVVLDVQLAGHDAEARAHGVLAHGVLAHGVLAHDVPARPLLARGDAARRATIAGARAGRDVVASDVDGCALAVELRRGEAALGRVPAPVVVLSAHVDDAMRARCGRAGIAECLEKPIGRGALAGVVARWGRRPRLAEELETGGVAVHHSVRQPATGRVAGNGAVAVAGARRVDRAPDSACASARGSADDPPLDAEAVWRLRGLEDAVPGLLHGIATDYAATGARRLGEIERAVAAGDAEAVARAAHALRGASASAGAARAAALAAALESAPASTPPLARLRAEVARASAALAALAEVGAGAGCAVATTQPHDDMCRYCDTERLRARTAPVRLIAPGSST